MLVASGCKEVCDDDGLPQYRLTAGQQAWVNPYVKGAVWRFRNAAGYERSYLIKEVEDKMDAKGTSKGTLCPTFYVQAINIQLERTDSVQAKRHFLSLAPGATNSEVKVLASLVWADMEFELPIGNVEDGVPPRSTGNGNTSQLHSQLVVGGRSYQNVLESSMIPFYTDSKPSSTVIRTFVTKNEGLVRFDTRAGTVWSRI
ncbi:hypothetical protein [Hymenobacter saemangeumensis]|uniref:hypothetical protein n=1 Tax=Hymenobacter saemangeumensis TaxID=1084522 RepID=UPI0031E9740B